MSTQHDSNSGGLAKPSKPAKPYPDFPLFPHANGSWAKKIRGKLHYFGPWNDPDSALAKYLNEKDFLHAGRKPRPDTDALTIKELCNSFLNAKAELRDVGEITDRTWRDYKDVCSTLVDHFGKSRIVDDLMPDDFAELRTKMAKKLSPVTLGNRIQRMRVVFKYAVDNALVNRPVAFGQGFKRPSKKTLRIEKAKKGANLFTPEEIRRLIDAAGQPMQSMILLGINCAFGNADVAKLPIDAMDLENGWIAHPRPKTGISRRCPLWPETIGSLQEWLSKRPKPEQQDHDGLLFITRYGGSWDKGGMDNPVAKETAKLLKSLGINRQKRRGFYTLRHVFRTVADESRDQPACDFIMGHESPHMATVYRETIGDDRLRAVTDYVRQWLFKNSTSV